MVRQILGLMIIGTKVRLYGDASSKLPQALGDQAAYGEPSYPSTLLVDRCGVIRHAFVGPLIGRRGAFDTALRRLAAATEGLVCPGDPPPLDKHAALGKKDKRAGKKLNKVAAKEQGERPSSHAGATSLPPKGKRIDVAQAGPPSPQPKKGNQTR